MGTRATKYPKCELTASENAINATEASARQSAKKSYRFISLSYWLTAFSPAAFSAVSLDIGRSSFSFCTDAYIHKAFVCLSCVGWRPEDEDLQRQVTDGGMSLHTDMYPHRLRTSQRLLFQNQKF